MSLRIYLAGPDVFFPDATARATLKKQICADYGFIGIDPLDTNIYGELMAKGASNIEIATAIEDANLNLMRSADAIVANLSPFRGPSADAGTCSECGFMRAYTKPALGYVVLPPNSSVSYAQRVGNTRLDGPTLVDADGIMVEDFGLYDNLMISVPLIHLAVRHADLSDWRGAFEECLIVLKSYVAGKKAE